MLGPLGIQKMPHFIDVPPKVVDAILQFELKVRGTGVTSRISGSRWEVFLHGVKSDPFQTFLQEHADSEKLLNFFASLRTSLADVAAENNGILSQDIVALVGGDYMQVPHVDLKPGQIQIIVAMTDTTPTLVYDESAGTPSMQQVERFIGVDPSQYPGDPRLEPLVLGGSPLVLPMDELYKAMVPACDEFKAGDAVQIRDGIVHAGPKSQDASGMSRVVIFTTYTMGDTQHYNVEYQYTVWTWALHTSVPPKIVYKRFQEICQYAKQNDLGLTPWTVYPGVHGPACQVLCDNTELDDETIEKIVSIWRTGGLPPS